MGVNFPTAVAVGEVFNASPGVSYVWLATGGTWAWLRAPMNTALPGNKIVNPAMQHSQQNGGTTGYIDSYYMADQWFSNGPNTSLAWGYGGVGPRGNPYIYGQVVTAIPSPPAAHTFSFQTRIEGRRIADLKWGTAQAEQIVVRFMFTTNKAGTYTVAVRNGPTSDRTYLAAFTVPVASVWTEYTLVIPGDTTGTWNADNQCGLILVFTFGSGSTFHGVAGWQAGSFRALSTNTNGADTVGNVFYLADVGLYRDPYKTGVAPEWETPDHQLELRHCKRYWQKLYGMRGMTASATVMARLHGQLLPPMRAAPSLSLVGTNSVFNGLTTATLTAIGSNFSNDSDAEADMTAGAGLAAAAYPGIQYYVNDATYIAANARM